MQADSPLYGRGGGSAFNTQGLTSVKSIRIRSGSLIDSIQPVYSNGQTSVCMGTTAAVEEPQPKSIRLNVSEKIVAIFGRSGALVDSLTFVTNLGRIFRPYGGGAWRQPFPSIPSTTVQPKRDLRSFRKPDRCNWVPLLNTGAWIYVTACINCCMHARST